MHVLSISFYYNDEYAAINCVIFFDLQWCYSDVSNVIKSNNFFNNGPLRVSFAHIMQHCILGKCTAGFLPIVNSIAARGFFVKCLTYQKNKNNGGKKKCRCAYFNRHKRE